MLQTASLSDYIITHFFKKINKKMVYFGKKYETGESIKA